MSKPKILEIFRKLLSEGCDKNYFFDVNSYLRRKKGSRLSTFSAERDCGLFLLFRHFFGPVLDAIAERCS